MTSSAAWKAIEIISEQFGDENDSYHELTISHDGRKDRVHLVRYSNVNELTSMSIGEEIAKYINDYL